MLSEFGKRKKMSKINFKAYTVHKIMEFLLSYAKRHKKGQVIAI